MLADTASLSLAPRTPRTSFRDFQDLSQTDVHDIVTAIIRGQITWIRSLIERSCLSRYSSLHSYPTIPTLPHPTLALPYSNILIPLPCSMLRIRSPALAYRSQNKPKCNLQGRVKLDPYNPSLLYSTSRKVLPTLYP